MGYSKLDGLLHRMTGDEKHSASATSALDVIWTLYDRVLNVDPADPNNPHRDRFLLSKGHGPMAYYAVLCAKGFFPENWLDDFGNFDSPLGQHPDRTLIPGVDISSGSLGHGLPIGLGLALALSTSSNQSHIYVLLGDGELDEGSNHEAIALAGRLKPANLTAIVIDNQSAAHGWPGGIAARFETERWQACTVNGRDHNALASALSAKAHGPQVVVAITEAKFP